MRQGNGTRPGSTGEGDWVLVYDSSIDNQHKVAQKFARRWFGPHTVTSANDNGTYHLAELDGTRLAVPVGGKWIKTFKKRNEDESELVSESDDADRFGPGEESEGGK